MRAWVDPTETGPFDFFAYSDAGQVWDGTEYVDWVDADYQDYRIAATAIGSSGWHRADAPADCEWYELRYRAGTLDDSYTVWTADESPNHVVSTGLAATQATLANTKLGTPVTSVSADIAAISTSAGALAASGVWSYGQRTLTDNNTTLVSAQQRGKRQIVQGDSYSSTARQILINASDGGEWPTDLSLYTWTAIIRKSPNNKGYGTDALTITPVAVTSTGDSRCLRLPLTAAQTGALALGTYDYGVQGTKSSENWTVETGVITVVEDYT